MMDPKIENNETETPEIMDEPTSDSNSKNYDELLDNFELTICIVCGMEVKSYWEPLYDGLRARCETCEINWAES